MKERVLITGDRGFIGKYVLKLLEKHYDIVTIKESLFTVNLKEYINENKPSYLIHLAWETKPGYLDSYNNVLFVQKSIELYDAFFQAGGKRAVYIGTEQEYERNNKPLDESTNIRPESLYAECKAYLGNILIRYSKINNNGFVWGRLFFVYGAGEKPKRLMPSIIKGMLNGEKITCSHKEYVRDYLEVEDVASAICTCLFSNYIGAVNIAGGRHTTIGEIASIIKSFDGAIGTISYRSHEECNQPYCIEADNTLLKSLGWKQKYSIEEGLKKEYEYYRKMFDEGKELE